jgi:hypothetical protein
MIFTQASTVTPVGIFLPASDELFLYAVTSKVTSDCLVDRLVEWWEAVKERFAHIKTLVINVDNGPENHSRRTQFMQRLVEFVNQYQVCVCLAYYHPPMSHALKRTTAHEIDFTLPLISEDIIANTIRLNVVGAF